MLGGAGFLWLGWTGFNGGTPSEANVVAAMAVLNTHICTATSLLVWLTLDMTVYGKSSVIGAVQGMITGLVCITPGAGTYVRLYILIIIIHIFSFNIRNNVIMYDYHRSTLSSYHFT